jgi:ubiquinone/menaquinone biosynthesis C-methylase UbiE
MVHKEAVRDFWDRASCGEEAYALGEDERAQLETQARIRYELEPYLSPFAKFASARGKDILEIGVGMGADHLRWAQAQPHSLTGVDLTPRAVAITQARLAHARLTSALQVADAEALPFAANSFDGVYSWGVLHHSPNTPQAFREVARVLRPGGWARIMVYHTYSLTGLMLWARFALLRGRPFTSLASIYSQYLESPGTKAYTVREGRKLCQQAGLEPMRVWVQLNHGDLLQGVVGQRHRAGLTGKVLAVAQRLWPRWFFTTFTPFLGLYLMIEAEKPRDARAVRLT